jgi:ADP-heptose:LPS heptosyltransferase
VILEVHAGLGAALQGLPGVSRLIENGVALPPFDLHCPLLSLPLAFGTDLDSIPASVPYITAAPDRVFAWRNRLGPRRVPRIGIGWSGNPQHREDKQRSIPLAQLAELFRDQPDREFHVLQNDVRESDRPALAALPHLRDHSRTLRDFADTAALVSLMDVVISVDTALVHLAGAMGWPVWVMLAAVPDWRWMLGRDDSPWYPSMWLFRQQRRGDWTPVLHDVARQLEDMLS